MRPASPAAIRLLAILAGVCLIGAVVAVAAGTGSSSKTRTVASGGPGGVSSATTIAPGSTAPTTTATPGSGAHTATTGAGGTTTKTTAGPAATSAPAVTAAPLAPAPGPVGDPGQPTATAAGVYRYAFSSTSSQGAESGTITETVSTQAASGGTTRQSVADTGGPQGTTSNQIVTWGSPGEQLLSQTFSIGAQSADCTWNPPIEVLPASLATGTKWAFSSQCQTTFSGQPVKINLSGNATVTGKKRLEVGGKPADVWTISVTYNISGTFGTVPFTDKHSATDEVAARLGLVVEEDASDTTSGGGRSGSTTSHRALQNLTPA